MSYLGCSRGNCQNIMCDRYSSEYGYICDECFEELNYSGPNTNIEEFMSSNINRNNEQYLYEQYLNGLFIKGH